MRTVDLQSPRVLSGVMFPNRSGSQPCLSFFGLDLELEE